MGFFSDMEPVCDHVSRSIDVSGSFGSSRLKGGSVTMERVKEDGGGSILGSKNVSTEVLCRMAYNVGQSEGSLDDCEKVVEWVDDGSDEDTENDRLELGLIGKLWTNRCPNPTAFISTLKNVWMVKYGVDIINIGRNLYRFQFSIGGTNKRS